MEKFKKLLEKEKDKLKRELKSFARPNRQKRDDYKTKMPQIGRDQYDNATEIAMYDSALPIEHNFELRLQRINKALEKINKGKYGVCAECKKDINPNRLELYPEARHCMKCHKAKVD